MENDIRGMRAVYVRHHGMCQLMRVRTLEMNAAVLRSCLKNVVVDKVRWQDFHFS